MLFSPDVQKAQWCKTNSENITKWRGLNKIQKPAIITINTILSKFMDHSEANEVMVNSILVNQYEDDSNAAENENEVEDPFINVNEL